LEFKTASISTSHKIMDSGKSLKAIDHAHRAVSILGEVECRKRYLEDN